MWSLNCCSCSITEFSEVSAKPEVYVQLNKLCSVSPGCTFLPCPACNYIFPLSLFSHTSGRLLFCWILLNSAEPGNNCGLCISSCFSFFLWFSRPLERSMGWGGTVPVVNCWVQNERQAFQNIFIFRSSFSYSWMLSLPSFSAIACQAVRGSFKLTSNHSLKCALKSVLIRYEP